MDERAARDVTLVRAIEAADPDGTLLSADEARQASRTSTQDISSGRRGGLRSHRGPGGRTRDQLYQEAREKNIKGRSNMTKAQLQRAVGR